MSGIRIALLAVLATLLVAAPATARPARTSSTTVTVTMTEFKFVLSKRTVPHGKIVFKLVNKGKIAHDFKIALHKSALIGKGKTGKLVVTLAKGLHPYKCTVDSHAKFGMKGVLKVT
jgi:plastocyanin